MSLTASLVVVSDDDDNDIEEQLTELEFLILTHWKAVFMRTPPRGWRYGVRALRFRGADFKHFEEGIMVSATRVNLKANDHRWNYTCGVVKAELTNERRDNDYRNKRDA